VKFTLEQLRNTKAGQDPKNLSLIAEAIRQHGPKADILTMGPIRDPKLQQDQTRASNVKRSTLNSRSQRVVLVVSIIRFGAKEMDDDNYIAGCKSFRDAIAKSLGVDDADRRIKWEYRQVIRSGRYGTLVKIDEV
jgi:hypothetical protein